MQRMGWIAAVLALCGLAAQATAQTVNTTGYYQSTLKWGTSSTAATTQHTGDTPQAAYDKCIEAGRAKATNQTASIVWSCEPVKWIGRTTVSTTCGPAPPPQERTGTCPSGQVGGWPQTRAYVSAPYPTCWQEGSTWNPSTPPAGACTTPTIELPAPSNLVASPATNDPTRIRVEWLAVTGAVAYSVERCIGSTCTGFSQIQCATTNAFLHGPLTPPVTVRYRVRASRAAGCPTTTGNLGAYSAVVSGTLSASAAGTASLSWTPPTQNTDGSSLTNLAGYRISYGQTATTLAQTIQVANPGQTSYTVTNLAPGNWYFAVRAYTSVGTESANSNVSGKVVN